MTTAIFKTLLDPGKIQIRWMIRRDLSDVLSIENRCFSDEAAWTEEDFLSHMRSRNIIGQVCCERGDDDRIIGHCIYKMHKRKLEILRIAVDPLRHGDGFGFAMLDKLKSKLSWDRRSKLVAHVPLDPKLCSWWKRQQFSGQWDKSTDQIKFIYHLPMEGK